MKPHSRLTEDEPVDDRRLFRRQFVALFVVISLLDIGFSGERAMREFASRHDLASVIRGWDGLAWYAWLLAGPATLWLIRRHPFNREDALRSVLRLTAGSALIYFVVTNLRFVLRMLPNVWLPAGAAQPSGWIIYLYTELERLPMDFLTYCGLFATSFAIDYYSKYYQRAGEVMRLKLHAAQLQSELVNFQLTALRGQLHPHFLFNSFNAISSLVRQQKNEVAVDMIAELSELLRLAMNKIEVQQLPLEQELFFVERYLRVERIRFGEKLNIKIEVSADALPAIVPNFLLQPLVENCIKHGISKRVSAGAVRIAGRRAAQRLRIEISNDGPEPADGFEPDQASGIGLRNTRSRLQHAYGDDYELELVQRPEGGAIIRLDLPWVSTPTPLSEPVASLA